MKVIPFLPQRKTQSFAQKSSGASSPQSHLTCQLPSLNELLLGRSHCRNEQALHPCNTILCDLSLAEQDVKFALVTIPSSTIYKILKTNNMIDAQAREQARRMGYVWMIIAYREYTKSGYERNSKKFNKNALDLDLSDKVVIVTGANSGLGKDIAAELFKRGALVHMLCRNEKTGEEARKDILGQINGDSSSSGDNVNDETNQKSKVVFDKNRLRLHKVDISDLKRVKEFVKEFESDGDGKCHILINNAGVMVNERSTTPYEVETNFSINTLGTYYLTKNLVPLLQKSGPGSRVVTVSSGGMLANKLDVTDLECKKMKQFDGTMAYAQNKRQQVELTNYWSQQYPESTTGIKFLSMHPGWVDTPGVRTSLETFYKNLKNQLRTVDQGIDTVLWAAFSKEASDIPSGSFLFDRQVASQHLPLAPTKSTQQEVEALVEQIDNYIDIALNFEQRSSS
nr:13006_t:CDS:2 [Entrophospora candida]